MPYLTALWHRIREPRVKKTIMAFAYLFAILVGVHTIVDPPTSIAGVLGVVLTMAWGGFYLIGGLLGLIAVFPGWHWMERWGITGIILGITIYVGVIMTLHVTSELGNRMPQFFAIAAAVPLFAYRLYDVRGADYEARRR